MTEKKYEKNIIYKTPPHPTHPKDAYPSFELFAVHDGVLKGAFCFTAAWVLEKGPEPMSDYKAHYHDMDEYLIFMGDNPDNYRELGAKIELWIENEKYIITESCAIFLPKKVPHCPLIMHEIDRPFLFCSTLPGPMHTGTHVPVPKDFVAP